MPLPQPHAALVLKSVKPFEAWPQGEYYLLRGGLEVNNTFRGVASRSKTPLEAWPQGQKHLLRRGLKVRSRVRCQDRSSVTDEFC